VETSRDDLERLVEASAEVLKGEKHRLHPRVGLAAVGPPWSAHGSQALRLGLGRTAGSEAVGQDLASGARRRQVLAVICEACGVEALAPSRPFGGGPEEGSASSITGEF
jgi:hypothetical protein